MIAFISHSRLAPGHELIDADFVIHTGRSVAAASHWHWRSVRQSINDSGARTMTFAAVGHLASRTVAVVAISLAILIANGTAPVCAQDYTAIIAQADRTEVDRVTDKRRDPVNLLTFTEAKAGWRMLDMGAGAGYSTELMARCVGPTGSVYGQVAEESEKLRARMMMPVMSNVTVLVRRSDDPVPSDLHNLDLITFYFAYHDTTYMQIDRARMNKAMFAALKPGGFLVIADHSARPEDGATVGKSYRRIAEQTLRSEVEAAGFKFVADAQFLRHPEDARSDIVFRNPTPVDEFVLKFQKPM
jgi:predicted methyltransferase